MGKRLQHPVQAPWFFKRPQTDAFEARLPFDY